MTFEEKKQLYNQIMCEVARTVKRCLNESVLDTVGNSQADSAQSVADQSWNNAIKEAAEDVLHGVKPDIDLQQYISVWKPENYWQFHRAVRNGINLFGETCSLNWIDTSEIEKMEELFAYTKFNGDISKWDTSSVTTMRSMFSYSGFNGDISEWDVSSVENMEGMFYHATKFNGCSLNDWDVSSVQNMSSMFYDCPYDQPLDKWDVSHVIWMNHMFRNSGFNQDISMWDVSSVEQTIQIFASAKIKREYWPDFTKR